MLENTQLGMEPACTWEFWLLEWLNGSSCYPENRRGAPDSGG
jgi:hypothetical protein